MLVTKVALKRCDVIPVTSIGTMFETMKFKHIHLSTKYNYQFIRSEAAFAVINRLVVLKDVQLEK